MIAQDAIQMQTIDNLVSAGMGLAWVLQSVTLLQRPGLVCRAVDGAALLCQTSLVWRENPRPVVQRFASHVLAQPQAHPHPPAQRQSAAV